MSRARATLSNAGLALAAVLVTLLLAEAALRLAGPDSFAGLRRDFGLPFLMWDGFRGNFLAAGVVHAEVSINREGHRGPELDPNRAKRIVCLGDSSTFGLWVERDPMKVHYDNYPDDLRALLEKAGRSDWQVVNAGVPGPHASHSLRTLRREILSLEPSIVTLRVGMNDHAARVLAWIEDPDSPAARRLLYALGKFRLFQLGIEAHFQMTGGPIRQGPRAPRIQNLDTFRHNLEAVAEESRRHDFRLLLIDYPLRPARSDDEEARLTAALYGAGKDLRSFYRIHARYQEVVREVARRTGVPLLVTAPHLLDPEQLGFSDDVVHPNSYGMKRTAELLYTELEERGWLDP